MIPHLPFGQTDQLLFWRESQKAVSAHFTSKQILLFGFCRAGCNARVSSVQIWLDIPAFRIIQAQATSDPSVYVDVHAINALSRSTLPQQIQ